MLERALDEIAFRFGEEVPERGFWSEVATLRTGGSRRQERTSLGFGDHGVGREDDQSLHQVSELSDVAGVWIAPEQRHRAIRE